MEGNDADNIKQMLADTNPVLLAVTLVVSVFHMLFDVLAFKNDISFWSGRTSYKGLSLRTLILGLVSQSVIFLYLVDTGASKLVLISSFLSLVIDLWKISRFVRLGVKVSSQFPFVSMAVSRDQALDASEVETDKHDATALKWMTILMSPLAIAYACYSLVYSSHKSWYSWVLGSFASAMYIGGFILMTPQLFINYKMKSVAHLPWRVFIYKALNTFIDDLFAFIITMPTMHRLSVFRDDIVFFVYLYQRWIYPVDTSRLDIDCDVPADDGQSTEKEETKKDK